MSEEKNVKQTAALPEREVIAEAITKAAKKPKSKKSGQVVKSTDKPTEKTAAPKKANSMLEMKTLSASDIDVLISGLMAEKLERAIQSEDPDVLVREALQTMFSGTGEPKPPTTVTPSLIALASMVQDSNKDRHNCRLFTIKYPDSEGDVWSWTESAPSFVHSDSEKVGNLRRSIALHVAVDGMTLVQHRMAHDGTRHSRSGCNAWRVSVTHDERTGEILATRIDRLDNWVASHLPVPEGENDQRSYAGKRAAKR